MVPIHAPLSQRQKRQNFCSDCSSCKRNKRIWRVVASLTRRQLWNPTCKQCEHRLQRLRQPWVHILMPRGGLLSSVCSSKPSYPSFAFTQRVHQETRSLSCQRGEIGLTSRMRDSTLSSSRGGVGHAKRPHRLHLHLTFSSSSSNNNNNNNNILWRLRSQMFRRLHL